MKNKEQNSSNNSTSNSSNASGSSSSQSQQSNSETIRVAPRMVKENFSRQSPEKKSGKKD